MPSFRSKFGLVLAWAAVAIGIGGIVVAELLGPRHRAPASATNDPESGRSVNELHGWGTGLLVAGVVGIIVGVVLFGAWFDRRAWSNEDRRAQRISRLSDSLGQALRDIESIKREVEEGTALLARLESERATQQELASLTKEQTVAVREFFSGAVHIETNRANWFAAAIGLVTFVGGILVSKFLGG